MVLLVLLILLITGRDRLGNRGAYQKRKAVSLEAASMKPPVCELCGKAFDFGEGGGTVNFANYKPLPEGLTGHPVGCLWFCKRHFAAAGRLSDRSTGSALKALRWRYPLWWLRLRFG